MEMESGMNLIRENDCYLIGNLRKPRRSNSMELDNTTYNDLSVFQHEEEFSIFHRLCFTRTSQGRDWLLKFFSNPFNDLKPILDTQQILRSIIENIDNWPNEISNGTLMVIEKFYDSNVDAIPNSNLFHALTYKFLNGADFRRKP